MLRDIKLPTPGKEFMWDLHGASETQAKAIVEKAIREAQEANITKVIFVTGRGNHVNNQGKRGTLFAKFPEWLQQSSHKEKIKKVNKNVGHYTVYLKPTFVDTFSGILNQEFTKYIRVNLDKIRESADAGEATNMALYGRLLEEGIVVKRDAKRAARYYKLSAQMGYPMSMHAYAGCLMLGKGVKQNDELAIKWLWKAHKAGNISSTLTLAHGYASARPGFQYDLSKAIELHKVAAEAGMAASMRFMSQIYLEGDGVEKCAKTAFVWQEKAAHTGDAKAQFNLACMYKNGQGVAPDMSKARYYFELGAKGGDADAQFMYGMNLLHQKNAEGLDWLELASTNGSEQATSILLRLAPDNEELLVRSAGMGNLKSLAHLTRLTKTDKPSVDDLPIANIVEKFKMLSHVNIMLMSPDAKYLLLDKILLFAKAKHKRKAMLCIKESVFTCPYAMRRLVYYHERGDGLFRIKKDKQQVLSLLKNAAVQDDVIAMVKLGQYYLEEKKSRQRIEAAKNLFRQASEQKYPPAFYHLGMMYEQGEYGDNKLREAFQCYQSAVKYEQLKGHVENFIFGPLDEYQNITDLANSAIKRIKPKLPKSKKSSLLNRGFFNKLPTKAATEEGSSLTFSQPACKEKISEPSTLIESKLKVIADTTSEDDPKELSKAKKASFLITNVNQPIPQDSELRESSINNKSYIESSESAESSSASDSEEILSESNKQGPSTSVSDDNTYYNKYCSMM